MNVRIARDGVEIGECDWEDLEQLVNEGQVRRTDHYWYEGMPDWRLLDDLIGLKEAESLLHSVDWEKGESAQPSPAVRRWRMATVAIGCAVIVVITAFYFGIIFRANRPDIPPPTADATAALERTDTALRTKATNELIARLDKLPTVALSPSYTFYNDLSIVIPDPPAPLTVKIRGWESVVDPATRQITSHANFMLIADFRQDTWFFKSYYASDNDFVHGKTIKTGKSEQDLVPPAIVSLLGLQIKK